MSVFGRIFGMGRSQAKAPESYVKYTNEDDSERLVMTADTSANAIAARHTFAQIYGSSNMPPEFGMKGVVQVRDKKKGGEWTPVTGSKRGIGDMDTQLGALASFRETGIIGPQPVNAGGSAASSARGGGAGGSGGASVSTSSSPSTASQEAGQVGPTILSYGQPPVELLESGIALAYGQKGAPKGDLAMGDYMTGPNVQDGAPTQPNAQYAATQPYLVVPSAETNPRAESTPTGRAGNQVIPARRNGSTLLSEGPGAGGGMNSLYEQGILPRRYQNTNGRRTN